MNQTFISSLMYVVYVSNIALILACLIFTILRSTGMLQVQGEYGTQFTKQCPAAAFAFVLNLVVHRTN